MEKALIMKQAGLDALDLSLQKENQSLFGAANLSLKANRIYILHGASGSGKSSLTRSLAGLEPEAVGEIFLDGELQTKPNRKIFYVSQDEDLFDWLTVSGHLHFLARCGADLEIGRKLVKEFELSNQLEQYPYQLSMGERKRLSMIRALMFSPQILILDETLSNLDRNLRERSLDYFASWVQVQARICLIVSHFSEELNREGFQILSMNDLKKEK